MKKPFTDHLAFKPLMTAMTPAYSQYMRRLGLFAIMTIVLSVVAVQAIYFWDVPKYLGIALAAASGLPFFGISWAVMRMMVEEEDEFLRSLVVQQVLFASLLTFPLAMIWGSLEQFDYVPHIYSFWWGIIWMLGLYLGAAYNKVMNGATGNSV